MASSLTTTDHRKIRKWIEDRKGHPARVRGAGEGGILRVDFGRTEENLEEIAWDDFFEIFDENQLAFLYQEKTETGATSRFGKFLGRH